MSEESLKIEILSYEEKEDGSAIITMELSDDVKMAFIEKGFNTILKEWINSTENKNEV